MRNATGNFAEHGFIEKIVFRTAEGHSCNAGVDVELHMLKFFGPAPIRLQREILGVDRLNHFPCSWSSIAQMPFVSPWKKPNLMLARRFVVSTKSEARGAQIVRRPLGQGLRGKC